MLGEIIAVAKSTFTRCPSAAGRLFKRLLRPAPAAVAASVVQNAARWKRELLAENAMLRQQLIVVGRAVKRACGRGRLRPPIRRVGSSHRGTPDRR